MKTKLFLIFGLIVIIPVSSLLWLGLGYAKEEQSMYRFRLINLLQEKLSIKDNEIRNLMNSKAKIIAKWLDDLPTTDTGVRESIGSLPDVNQIFILSQDNIIRFPNPGNIISKQEQDFLYRTQRLRQELVHTLTAPKEKDTASVAVKRPSTSSRLQRKEKKISKNKPRSKAEFEISVSESKFNTAADFSGEWNAQSQLEGKQQPAKEGWVAWFWEEGLNVVFWKKTPKGLFGVELHRVKLLSDIIAALPGNELEFNEQHPFVVTLSDSRNQVVYQWGDMRLEKKDKPVTSIPLSFPLNAWTLSYYAPPSILTSRTPKWSIFTGLTAVFITLMTLAIYFYRENTREIREAQKRVNFVNQVSHELKTPLTNIRMYAELVQEDSEELDEQTDKRIRVIVSESQRLSRMIANVLSFSKDKNNKLHCHRQTGKVDDCVNQILKNFAPSLKKKGMEIRLQSNAGELVKLDCDIIEQILNNMISNAEKYAVEGKFLDIQTSQASSLTTILVKDYGPGIDQAYIKKVFDEFYRINNSLNEGVSGAGIGLAIARKLARLHGGDIQLTSSDKGCEFTITIETPKVKS